MLRVWLLAIVMMALAGCSGGTPKNGDTSTSQGASFEVMISGALDIQRADIPYKRFINLVCSDGEAWQLQFIDSGKTVLNILFYDEKPNTGNYQIVPTDGLFEGIGVLVGDYTGEDMRIFASNPSGTLTLTVDDGLYSGNFSFTATDGVSGQIEAVGSFANVPSEDVESDTRCFGF